MSNHKVPLDHDALPDLLNDPIIIRIVTVLNLASLSILELLEYGFTRRDINRAMAKGIIEFDKSPMPYTPEAMSKKEVVQKVMETGDYYFGLLSSKLRLSKLGLYILELIDGETESARSEAGLEKPDEKEGTFGGQAPQLQNDRTNSLY